MIAAGLQAMTPDQVREQVVSDDFLAGALSYLSGATTPTPVTPTDIATFLPSQATFVFALEQGEQTASAVFFPAPAGVQLSVPAFGGEGAFSYAFGAYNSSSSDYLSKLNDYLNALKVQVADEQANRARALAANEPGGDGPSIATYIFGDYFAMLGRLTLQAMRDGLRNFKLLLSDVAGKTAQEILDTITAYDAAYTLTELFTANQQHPLDPDAGAAGAAGLAIAGLRWRSPGGKSFSDIAALALFRAGFDATALALANAADATIIAPAVPVRSYVTQSGDSLATIAAALGFGTDVSALLNGVPELLTSTTLLASQAILAVPAFRHPVASGDTLQNLAAQFGVSLEALAGANGDVKALFLDDAQQLDLNVPHLERFQVGALIDEMKRTLALQHVGAMASRYYLHGLRLPTTFPTGGGLKAKADGLFVKAGGAYPDDLGLFALTGQAFPLGTIPDPSQPGAAQFSFTVDRASETWLSLGDEGSASVTFTLTDAADYQRYSQLAAAAAGYLDTQAGDVQPVPVGAVKPRRFPLSTEIPWQPAANVTLPRQPSAPANPKPRLWALPDELVNLPHEGTVQPTLKPLIARSDEATGTTVDDGVANYGFGTLVTFKVKKLGDTGASALAQRTYEIIGAPESEIALLERLLDQLKSDLSSFDQVNLFYRPSSTGSEAGGWQSDDPALSVMGITQTNLSTETRPPVSRSDHLLALAGAGQPNLIGTPNEFLRLLWEASITRQGGFYLSYTTGVGSGSTSGLPDHAFNDRGEAEVAVCALFATGSSEGQRLRNFMNVAVTNEAFDLSDAALVAEAVPVSVAAPRAFAADDSLASYAAYYYTGVGVLAQDNAALAFAGRLTLTVAGGVYQVPPNPTASPTQQDPGANLGLIASHFGTTPADIRAVNPGPLPDTLAPLTALKLPLLAVASDGQSLQSLAGFYGVPLAELAAANRDVAGLYPAAPLTVSTGPASLAPTVKRGVAGLQLMRTAPVVPDSPVAGWATAYLAQNFSLLGYRVAANAGNPFFAESVWGLPSGPVDPDTTPPADKRMAPSATGAGDTWHFAFSVPYASLLGAASPYAGVGSLLQFDLAWLDVFGNRILSEFDDPAPPAGTPFQRAPQLLGYTDRLLGIGQWPGVANAYQVVKDTKSGDPSLKLELDFDAASYEAAAGGGAAGKLQIEQSIATYTLIVEQLADPAGTVIELATSLTPGTAWTLPDTAAQASPGLPSLRAWAQEILAFLQSLLATAAPAPAPYVATVALDAAKLSGDEIFKLETWVTTRRDPRRVAGELATVSGIADAPTAIAPFTGSLTAPADAQPQRTLNAFAQRFTEAFASLQGLELRIATGADNAQYTGTATAPLWVVQLGTQGCRQADLVHDRRPRQPDRVRAAAALQRARLARVDADHPVHDGHTDLAGRAVGRPVVHVDRSRQVDGHHARVHRRAVHAALRHRRERAAAQPPRRELRVAGTGRRQEEARRQPQVGHGPGLQGRAGDLAAARRDRRGLLPDDAGTARRLLRRGRRSAVQGRGRGGDQARAGRRAGAAGVRRHGDELRQPRLHRVLAQARPPVRRVRGGAGGEPVPELARERHRGRRAQCVAHARLRGHLHRAQHLPARGDRGLPAVVVAELRQPRAQHGHAAARRAGHLRRADRAARVPTDAGARQPGRARGGELPVLPAGHPGRRRGHAGGR